MHRMSPCVCTCQSVAVQRVVSQLCLCLLSPKDEGSQQLECLIREKINSLKFQIGKVNKHLEPALQMVREEGEVEVQSGQRL